MAIQMQNDDKHNEIKKAFNFEELVDHLFFHFPSNLSYGRDCSLKTPRLIKEALQR